MGKEARSAEQIFRIDGKNVFVEITTYGLGIDKVFFNFVEYNTRNAKGQRTSASIGIYMDIFEAQALSRDILSGRIAKLGAMAKEKAAAKGQKYASAVFLKQGGKSAKSNKGQAISRIFEITPGDRQPWVLCAKQGKAHETPQGLIVMDGSPECTIRVPLTNELLKQFALAIEAAVQTWIQLRFVTAAAPAMQISAERRTQAINQKKAEAAAASRNQSQPQTAYR